MKTRTLLLMIAVAFVSCAMPSPSVACTQPPIQSGNLLALTTWPALLAVGVFPTNVPIGPVTTAANNLNLALGPPLMNCAPGFFVGQSNYPGQIDMSYNAIPPPATCPAGMTCYTRGLTDFVGYTASGRLQTATTQINSAVTSTAALAEVIAHEFGHTMGLLDCNYPSCAPGSSVMENSAPLTSINGTEGQPGPTICDTTAVTLAAPDYVCLPPPPPPDCPPCDPDLGCPICYRNCNGCPSPIILDLSGHGFFLTSAANGVTFDITGTGHPIQLAWTAKGADNAFLALPGADGLVHNGKQLFGNFTSQPPSLTQTASQHWPSTTCPRTGAMVTALLTPAMPSSLRCVCGSTPTMTTSASQKNYTPCRQWE